MQNPSDFSELQAWIGRSEHRHEQLALGPAVRLWATLNSDRSTPEPEADLPELWHWLYFTPLDRQEQLGRDGHPMCGGLLPPVHLPRRMWAGGQLEFYHPLRIGEEIQRKSTIADISVKQGRSGRLVFVAVTHEMRSARGLAITEVQNLVFCDDVQSRAAYAEENAPTNETFAREVVPDPVLLFRFSALTFNAHRIHYDRTYACNVEGYRGLVVQGPLIATLLIDLLRRHEPTAVVRRVTFKSLRPLFDDRPFTVCGRGDAAGGFALWARDYQGSLAMEATAAVAGRALSRTHA
jgi:3-methylfumaryl-CoA hydratase